MPVESVTNNMNVSHPDCQFCKLLRQPDAPVVYHDAHLVVIFEQIESADCHMLLIPREHAAALLDLLPEAATDVMYVASLLAKAIPDVTSSTGVALWQSELDTPQVIADMHFHLHLVSHQEGDGRMIWLPTGETPSPEEIEPLAVKLRHHLRDTPPEGMRASVVQRVLEQRHLQRPPE